MTTAPETSLAEHERLLIIDFGSQVTQLIARRVRESGVYCEVVPYDKAEAHIAAKPPKAVPLKGGKGLPSRPSGIVSDVTVAEAPALTSVSFAWARAR